MTDHERIQRELDRLSDELRRIQGRREASAVEAPAKSLDGVSVLVVDDERDSSEAMRLLLETFGASVRAASSAREALAAIDDGLPDVIVSDIVMPEVDGFALIRTIRSRAPGRGGQVPALAVTGLAGDLERRKAIDRGYQECLVKPVDATALVAAIAALLGR